MVEYSLEYKYKHGLHIQNDGVTIIENSDEARTGFGFGEGSQANVLTDEHIKALQEGRCLAIEINGGEYTQFILMEKFLPKE